MIVEQAKVTELLRALGVDSVDRWDAAKIASKINQEGGIARYRDATDSLPLELDGLYTELVTDQTAGNLIEVAPSEARTDVPPAANGKPKKKTVGKRPKVVKKPARVKPKPAKKKAAPLTSSRHRAARYDGFATFKEWTNHLKKNPKPLPDDGVIAVTVRELKAAGKAKNPKGVTKEYLIGVLKAEFPDRPVEKMLTNLNNNVPTRLLWMYGVHVWTFRERGTDDKTGYFIVGDGKDPQPVATVETPKPKAKKKPNKKKAKK